MSVEGPEIGVRIRASGSDEIRQALQATGDAGVSTFERVDRASRALDFSSLTSKVSGALNGVSGLAQGAFSKLEGAVNTVANGLGSVFTEVQKVAGAFDKTGVIAGAGLAGIVVATRTYTQSIAEAASATDDMADQVGLGVEAFSRLQAVMRSNGEDAEKLGPALLEMRRKIIGLAEGSQTAIDTFDELGLSIDAFRGKNGALLGTREQMDIILDRLKLISSPALRAKAAFDLFGASGKSLSSILADGSAGLRTAEKDVAKFGTTLDKATVDGFGESLAAQAKLSESLRGLGLSLAKAFYPFFSASSEGLTNWVTSNREKIEGWLKSLVGVATKVRSDVVSVITSGVTTVASSSAGGYAGGLIKKASLSIPSGDDDEEGGASSTAGDEAVKRQVVINGKLIDLSGRVGEAQAKTASRMVEINGKLVDLDAEKAAREESNARGQAIVNGELVTLRNRAAEAAAAANAKTADSDDDLVDAEKENLEQRSQQQERFAIVDGERVRMRAQQASYQVRSIGADGGSKLNFPVINTLAGALGVVRDGVVGVARGLASKGFSDFIAFLNATYRAGSQAGQAVFALGRAFVSGLSGTVIASVSLTGIMRAIGTAFRDLRLGIERGFKTEWAQALSKAFVTVRDAIGSLIPSGSTFTSALYGFLTRAADITLGLAKVFAGTVAAVKAGVASLSDMFGQAKGKFTGLFGGSDGVGMGASKVSLDVQKVRPVLGGFLGEIVGTVLDIGHALNANFGVLGIGLGILLTFWGSSTKSFLLSAVGWVAFAASIAAQMFDAFSVDANRSASKISYEPTAVLGRGFTKEGFTQALAGPRASLDGFITYVAQAGSRLIATFSKNWGDLGAPLGAMLGLIGAFSGSTKTILAGLLLAAAPFGIQFGQSLFKGFGEGGSQGGAQQASFVQKTGLGSVSPALGEILNIVRLFAIDLGPLLSLSLGAFGFWSGNMKLALASVVLFAGAKFLQLREEFGSGLTKGMGASPSSFVQKTALGGVSPALGDILNIVRLFAIDLGPLLSISLGAFGFWSGNMKLALASVALFAGAKFLQLREEFGTGLQKGVGGAQPSSLVQKTGLTMLAPTVGGIATMAVRNFATRFNGPLSRVLTSALDVVLAFASKFTGYLETVAKALGFKSIGGLGMATNGILLLVVGLGALTGSTAILIPALTLLAVTLGATFYSFGIATLAANFLFTGLLLGSKLVSVSMLIIQSVIVVTRALVIGAFAAMRTAALAFWAFMTLGPVAFWAGIVAIAALAAFGVFMIIGHFDSIEEAWTAMCAGLVTAWNFTFELLKFSKDDLWKFETWAIAWEGFWQQVANGGIWAWNTLKSLFGLDKVLGRTDYYGSDSELQKGYNSELQRLGLDKGELSGRYKGKGAAAVPDEKAVDPDPMSGPNDVITGSDGVQRLKSEEMIRLQKEADERTRMRREVAARERALIGNEMQGAIKANAGKQPDDPKSKAAPNAFDRLRGLLPDGVAGGGLDGLKASLKELITGTKDPRVSAAEGLRRRLPEGDGALGVTGSLKGMLNRYDLFGIEGLMGGGKYDDTLRPGQRPDNAAEGGESKQYDRFDNDAFYMRLQNLAQENPGMGMDGLLKKLREDFGATNRSGAFPNTYGTIEGTGTQERNPGVRFMPDFGRDTPEDQRSPIARGLQDRLFDMLPERSLGSDPYATTRQGTEEWFGRPEADQENNPHFERQASYRPGGGMNLNRLLAAFGGMGGGPATRTAYADGPVRVREGREERLTPGERTALRDRAEEGRRRATERDRESGTVVGATVTIQPGDKKLYGNRAAFDGLAEILTGLGLRSTVDQPRTT